MHFKNKNLDIIIATAAVLVALIVALILVLNKDNKKGDSLSSKNNITSNGSVTSEQQEIKGNKGESGSKNDVDNQNNVIIDMGEGEVSYPKTSSNINKISSSVFPSSKKNNSNKTSNNPKDKGWTRDYGIPQDKKRSTGIFKKSKATKFFQTLVAFFVVCSARVKTWWLKSTTG